MPVHEAKSTDGMTGTIRKSYMTPLKNQYLKPNYQKKQPTPQKHHSFRPVNSPHCQKELRPDRKSPHPIVASPQFDKQHQQPSHHHQSQ